MSDRKSATGMLLVLALALACKATAQKGADVDQDTAKLSRELGVSVPAGARVLGVKRMRGIDDAVFVKLELTTAAWEALLASSPLKADDLAPENGGYLAPNDGWWDPASHPGLRAAQATLASGRILNVGVDLAGDSVVAYLMNHGR